MDQCNIREATEQDVPLLLGLIRELAAYERLADQVHATEAGLRDAMFGERRTAEAVIAEVGVEPIGYGLFFHNFSTFTGKPGLWVEDIFIRPAFRARGHGRALFRALAAIAQERGCGRMEWSALDWNSSAIGFYLGFGARRMDEWTIFRLDEAGVAKLAKG